MTTSKYRPVEVIAYHGSGCAIEAFDYAFTGMGNDQNGSGFYFTTSLEEACAYTAQQLSGQLKPGGQDAPTVHVARLTFTHLLGCDEAQALSATQAKAIIKRAPNLEEALWNWGEVDSEGVETVLNRAVATYEHHPEDGPLIRRLFMLANDFYGDQTEAFNRAVRDVLGIDGVIELFDTKTHYVVFFPEQIEILERVPAEEARLRLVDSPNKTDRPRQ